MSFSRIVIVAFIAVIVVAAFRQAEALRTPFSDLKKKQLFEHARKHNTIKRITAPVTKSNNIQITDPQPKSMIIMVTNRCTQDMFLDEMGTFMESGGFDVAPAAYINHGESETLVAMPDIGSDHINGTFVYYGDAFVVWSAFGEVKGEWFLEVSYPTVSDVALLGSVPIGKRAFYNIVVGKESGGQC